MNILEARRRTLGKGVYKKTVEGNPAIAQGSLARRYPGITMQGWTTQDGTPTPETPVPIVSAGTQNQETGKWEYEVKLTGANLFNPDGERVSGLYMGTPLHNKSSVCMQLYEKDPDVDVTGCYIGLSVSGIRPDGGLGWVLSNGNLNNSGLTAIDSMDVYVTWYPAGETILQKIINRYDVMVNIGKQPLPYQPYKEQTVLLQSDRPLTKWDKLEKRNGQWGWVCKSAEKVLDGTETYVLGGGNYISDFSSNCYTIISDMIIDGRDNAFMNRLSNIDYSWIQTEAIGFSKNLAQLHVRISNADLGTTGESSGSEVVAAMKAYMAQQYEDGNPFIALYETAEETFVPLAESEQEAMNELYTFRPTTVLSNDCGCNMTLTYKTKKSLEVTD